MDLHQLNTFVVVAREGSITRASERLYLSQPAVSAHIKAIEDTLGLTLFGRTPRGMSLTGDGQRLLIKAEQTLHAHQELIEEATRIKGRLNGKLRLGTAGNSSTQALGSLLTVLSERYSEVELALQHGTSVDTLAGIRRGTLDAGFYNEAGQPPAELAIIEVAHFKIYLAAAPGLVAASQPLDWKTLAELPWICPTSSTCCGRAAENLFEMHQIRPKRIINIDRETVTRTLIAGKVGVGLLHASTAKDAQASGEVELVCEAQSVRVLFAHLASRAHDPLLSTVSSILRTMPISGSDPS
jgi:DNA-binding transcriptional LysR family regulator